MPRGRFIIWAGLLPMGVIINEILTHAEFPMENAIEIYHSTPEAVSIGGGAHLWHHEMGKPQLSSGVYVNIFTTIALKWAQAHPAVTGAQRSDLGSRLFLRGLRALLFVPLFAPSWWPLTSFRAGRTLIGVAAFWAFLAPLAGLDFYIDYSDKPDAVCLVAYDLSILSPSAAFDLGPGQKVGNRFFAYISVGEVAPDAIYRQEIAGRIPVFAKNEIWKSDIIDIAHPDWPDFVVKKLAARAMEKKFDGFFLDTVDTVEALSEKYPSKAAGYRAAMVHLIQQLKQAYPGQQILLNRGFAIFNEVTNLIDGVLIESLFQTYDFKAKKYLPVADATRAELMERIKEIQAARVPVFIVDYVDPNDLDLAEKTADRIKELGCHALITTPDLEGKVLAPLRQKPRSLLTLFGAPPEDGQQLFRWPGDCFVAKIAQTPLEWLGYEVDYLNITSNFPPAVLESRYQGILIDPNMEVPLIQEEAFVDWLIAQKNRGLKVIFFRTIPLIQEESIRRLLTAFGLRGDWTAVFGVTNLAAGVLAPQMNFEAKVRLRAVGFRNFQAPPEARVYFSVKGQKGSERLQYDTVFTTPWGGMALDPYLLFRRPDYHELWLIDPFHFFASALEAGDAPVPDPTTRDGLRVFFSHIDGDGFRDLSEVEFGKRSSEIIRDYVLKKYPVPVTVSVIEAEIRARAEDQKPEEEPALVEIARSMFALPNVQAASHTYSHPFYMIEGDPTAANYEHRTLPLVKAYEEKTLDLQKEVVGSVRYIQKTLLPPEKKLSLLLWPGNCRPPPEAIALTRQLGIENMNGGDTLMSPKYPSITDVAPRTMPWADEIEIYAANQNDSKYTDDWKGPMYGGFAHVVDTFKLTESPRRLKPVNIYYHMYSGDYYDSLKALLTAYDWAMGQKLHALTAVEFAEIARDSRRTLVLQRGQNRWVLLNEGKLRTFRWPNRGLWPDLKKSRGVTGYCPSGSVVYIHTDGSRRVELTFSPRPAAHPFLWNSSAEIHFKQLDPQRIAFEASDWRPPQVELAGLGPRSRLTLRINDKTETVLSDSAGHLALTLPIRAQVTIEGLPAQL